MDPFLAFGSLTADIKKVYPGDISNWTAGNTEESTYDSGGTLNLVSTMPVLRCLHRRISVSVGT